MYVERANLDETSPRGNGDEQWSTATRGRRGGIKAIVTVAFALGLFMVFYSAWMSVLGGGSRIAANRTSCRDHLTQIGIALHDYHDDYGSFPPAYIAAEDGTPMHSWRVLLLPYLDRKDLYNEYRFDEPWDSLHNLKIAVPLAIYLCPSQPDKPSQETNYLAVIGERTCWPGARHRTIREISDGSWSTVQVVEVADSGILWTEPRDLHVLQMNAGVNAAHGQGPSSHHPGGMMVLLADGSVKFVTDDFSPDILKAYLTVDDGEPTPTNGEWRHWHLHQGEADQTTPAAGK